MEWAKYGSPLLRFLAEFLRHSLQFPIERSRYRGGCGNDREICGME